MPEKQMNKVETFHLWWMSQETGRRIHAGVAFYDELYNEFRLKIDCLQALMGENESRFYAKAVGVIDDRMYYRVEAVVKKGGKFNSRRVVGEGYSSKETENEVHLDFGPIEKILVLSLDTKERMKLTEPVGS